MAQFAMNPRINRQLRTNPKFCRVTRRRVKGSSYLTFGVNIPRGEMIRTRISPQGFDGVYLLSWGPGHVGSSPVTPQSFEFVEIEHSGEGRAERLQRGDGE